MIEIKNYQINTYKKDITMEEIFRRYDIYIAYKDNLLKEDEDLIFWMSDDVAKIIALRYLHYIYNSTALTTIEIDVEKEIKNLDIGFVFKHFNYFNNKSNLKELKRQYYNIIKTKLGFELLCLLVSCELLEMIYKKNIYK